MAMIRFLGALLAALVVAALTAWGALALYFAGTWSEPVRAGLAALYGLAGLAAIASLLVKGGIRGARTAFLVALFLLFAWYQGIEPSNDRDWRAEEAVLPYAGIEGDLVTLHNIRNFDYRSENDFDTAYYDKTFDLRKLEGVDVIAVYWMGPAIAHVMLSFDFGGDDKLAVSIEARKEKGEGYSTVKGFFRQYELYYVVADERDVIRVRTNYRNDPPEDVYLYRVGGKIENARRVFVEYIHKINALKERPEFYNSLTTNCTSNIWLHTRVNPGHLPYSWKLLASGYVPEYLYEQGRLDTRMSFAELMLRGHVNARARAADTAQDFSRRIREGLPIPAAQPTSAGGGARLHLAGGH